MEDSGREAGLRGKGRPRGIAAIGGGSAVTPLDLLACWAFPQQAEAPEIIREDLEAFDRLPAGLRRAIDQFPLRLQSQSVHRALATFGEAPLMFALGWAEQVFISPGDPSASPIWGKEVLL